MERERTLVGTTKPLACISMKDCPCSRGFESKHTVVWQTKVGPYLTYSNTDKVSALDCGYDELSFVRLNVKWNVKGLKV